MKVQLREGYPFKHGNIIYKGGEWIDIPESVFLSYKQLFEDPVEEKKEEVPIPIPVPQTEAVHEGDVTDRAIKSPNLRGKRKKNESGKSE